MQHNLANVPEVSQKLVAALETCLAIFDESPRELPMVPQGWADRAGAALATGQTLDLLRVGLELRQAHFQYPATWEHRAWLWELRECLPERKAVYDKLFESAAH